MDRSDNSLQNLRPDGLPAETSGQPVLPDPFFFRGHEIPPYEEASRRYFTLLYVMRGTCEYSDGQPGNDALTLSAGQYFLSDRPPEQAVKPGSDFELLGCYFSASLFADELTDETGFGALLRHPALGFPAAYPADELCRRILTDSNGRIFKLLESAEEACKAKEICYRTLIRSLLTMVLILTAHRTVSGTSEAGRSRIVSYLCNYVQSNYAKNISLTEICRAQYLNPSFISRKFKETTGMTFEQYLQTARMQNAKTLLTSTDLSVEEICLRVGYTDAGSFRKIFKRICGVSPTEFRRFHT